jgi:hypothetical protein
VGRSRDTPGASRTFYRIVKTDPPTEDDFRSSAAKGRAIPAGLPPHWHGLWDGISVYATRPQAVRKARKSRMLGSFIAEIRIAEGDPIRIERTTSDPGHHTLWGQAAALIYLAEQVWPVPPPANRERAS